MTFKEFLNIACFVDMVVKYKEKEFRFEFDEELFENMEKIFAQEFLNLEVKTVGARDDYTLVITLKEKQNECSN